MLEDEALDRQLEGVRDEILWGFRHDLKDALETQDESYLDLTKRVGWRSPIRAYSFLTAAGGNVHNPTLLTMVKFAYGVGRDLRIQLEIRRR